MLAPGGQLFIYTRTPQQKARTIWGRYFPGFTEHEQRLRSEAAFRDAVRRTGGLKVVATQAFRHPRSSTAGRLRARAEGRHYSTFSRYAPEELRASIATFLARLPGPEACWVDEYLLVVVGGSRRDQADPDGPGSLASRAITDQALQISAGRAGQAPQRRLRSRPAAISSPAARTCLRQHHVQRRPGRSRNTTSPAPDVRRSSSGLAVGSAVPTAGGRPPPAPAATRWPSAADCDNDPKRPMPPRHALAGSVRGSPSSITTAGSQDPCRRRTADDSASRARSAIRCERSEGRLRVM